MRAAISNLLYFAIALALLWGVGSWIVSKTMVPRLPYRVGNMNGVPVKIPVKSMWRWVEYADKSIWEGRKPGDKQLSERTFDDAIDAFNLYLKWPELRPQRYRGEADPSEYDASEGHPWLLIGINGRFARTPRPPETPQNGLARVLNGKVVRLARNTHTVYNPVLKKAERVKGMVYEFRGGDSVTGLQHAVPVGPGTERLSGSNRILYWRGDRDASVDVLISCATGVSPNPRIFHRCTHEYQLPEMGAYVSVYYTRNWLPQWREIQARTREQILGFRVMPEDSEGELAPAVAEQTE